MAAMTLCDTIVTPGPGDVMQLTINLSKAVQGSNMRVIMNHYGIIRNYGIITVSH